MSQPSSSTASAMSGKLLKAVDVAAPFQDAITSATSARKQAGQAPVKLIGILATPSAPSIAYAEWTRKACETVGIEFEIWKTWEDKGDGEHVSSEQADDEQSAQPAPSDFDLEADVEDLIISANADDTIHGIMVYYPIFGGRQDTYLQQIVDPRKDVEGLHFTWCWNMYHNVRWANVSQLGGAPGTTSERPADSEVSASSSSDQPPPGFAKSILPCTPLAIVKCLESMGVYDMSLPYGDRLQGKTVTIFNRSEVVGRPLAALLANDGAKVYSVDVDSIQEFAKREDIDADASPSSDADVSEDVVVPSEQGQSSSGGRRTRTRSAQVLLAHQRNASLRLRTHHVVRRSELRSPQECVERSHVVIAGVPSPSFKVPTEWVREGAAVVNFSSEKNFDKDVRTRAALYLPAIGKTTIAMLQRNLLRLVEYREIAAQQQSEV